MKGHCTLLAKSGQSFEEGVSAFATKHALLTQRTNAWRELVATSVENAESIDDEEEIGFRHDKANWTVLMGPSGNQPSPLGNDVLALTPLDLPWRYSGA